MKLGSLDTFLIEDSFWQDKMGKPVVNQEFLHALLQYGTLEALHIFCRDMNSQAHFEAQIERLLPPESRSVIKTSLQAGFIDQIGKTPVDCLHQGDFTYHMPYLMELRNRLRLPLPVSGVTHSLDGAWMQARFIQILLANPMEYDCIVCTSKCAKDLLTHAFSNIREGFAQSCGGLLPNPPEMVQIPLGLSEGSFQIKDRRQCRDELKIPTHHCILLSIARFSPRQKMDLAPLLETIQWLSSRRKIAPFTLILAGAGKPADLELARSMVASLNLQDMVRIEGNVSREKKASLYSAADFFISVSDNFQETFGLTILEAMAHGLPVIASDFNGYKELVDNGRTGFLIPTYGSVDPNPWDQAIGLLDPSSARFYYAQKIAVDLSMLAQAIEELASNPARRQEMAIRARANAMRYHWQAIIPRYEELWLELKQKAMAVLPPSASNSQISLLSPQTKSLYSHYPTAWLEGTAQVALTPYGMERSRENFKPVLYTDLDVLLDQDCLDHLLSQLSRSAWKLEDLVSNAASFFHCSQSTIVFHIDWLTKHGYIVPTTL